MADIAKCRGTNCTVKDTCYRYTTKADEYYQVYMVEVPGHNEKCEYYWSTVKHGDEPTADR